MATGGRPAELARLNVDVIVTGGTHSSFAAAKVTTTIPIVFVGVAGPLEAGLVTSLARPGGNITGLAFDVTPETVAKRLELFKEVAPKAARLGHLVNPNNPFFSLYIRSVEIGAQTFRVELQRVEVRAPKDFDGAFMEIGRLRSDGLLVQPDVLLVSQRSRVVEFAAKNRLPAMYGAREFVEVGGLLSYSPHVPEMFSRADSYVDRILRGTKPGDLPIEQPRKFDVRSHSG